MPHTARRASKPANTLDWDDLRIAFAATEGASLAGVARLLQIQHSTVLRRIDALTTPLRLLTHSDLRRTVRARVFTQHVGDAPALQRSHAR